MFDKIFGKIFCQIVDQMFVKIFGKIFCQLLCQMLGHIFGQIFGKAFGQIFVETLVLLLLSLCFHLHFWAARMSTILRTLTQLFQTWPVSSNRTRPSKLGSYPQTEHGLGKEGTESSPILDLTGRDVLPLSPDFDSNLPNSVIVSSRTRSKDRRYKSSEIIDLTGKDVHSLSTYPTLAPAEAQRATIWLGRTDAPSRGPLTLP